MARFYTSASNSRGNTTTAQGRATGQTVHTRGWNTGIRVESKPSSSHGDKCDVFEVYATAGSRGGRADVLLGLLRERWDGSVEWVPTTPPHVTAREFDTDNAYAVHRPAEEVA